MPALPVLFGSLKKNCQHYLMYVCFTMQSWLSLCIFVCVFFCSCLSVWSVSRKKPLTTVKQAHGLHGDVGLEEPYWVSSVAALQNSDTIASGAHARTHLIYVSAQEHAPKAPVNYFEMSLHPVNCSVFVTSVLSGKKKKSLDISAVLLWHILIINNLNQA